LTTFSAVSVSTSPISVRYSGDHRDFHLRC
ncbi:hypothetical protein A2U01_0102487, partial [Trifolium medium]|nr:hypothetical protein [Trifolium medium]